MTNKTSNEVYKSQNDSRFFSFEIMEDLSDKDSVVFTVKTGKSGLKEFLVSTYLKIVTELGERDNYGADLQELIRRIEEEFEENFDKIITSEEGCAPFHIRIYITPIIPDETYQIRFYDNLGLLENKGGIKKFASEVLK